MLTTHQKQLIQQTIPVLKANGEALTDYFYHRMLSQVPELKETFNMGHQRDGKQAKALANAVLAYAENIEDPSVLLPVVNMICQKHVSLNIQAPDYAVVGDHLLHSISEVLSVPMEDELINAWAIAYHQLADLMIETEKGIYTQLAQEKGGWTGWREFTIVKKVSETTTVSSIYLAPTDKLVLPDYLPGQYISVRVQVPSLGYKQPRQYSLSTAPNGQFFRITVKEENLSQEPGYVSSTLHQQMQIGDRIEVSAPIGDFIIQDATKDNVLISAGIGITPMMAMLEGLTQTLTSSSHSAINFIHVTQDTAHYALSAEVNRLTEQHSCIKTLIHYSQAPATQRCGRFTLESVPASLLPEDADFYLCGPTGFIQSVYKGLLQRGISSSRIHYEVFTTGGLASA
ncbi:NO-inducible flavohemoprotein [Tatumella ptyseos]|uniref:NO-inducible flavohemoprotein n=1 Tax=Tatumella ptyseos TaxID=82987 RepID=UPI0026F0D1BA|nr:NO-inducible flavohemoprotein [Tatumella ptyseos]WKX27829.1 NO-inducible flavohemoprotein [Tatumella ptyseos]